MNKDYKKFFQQFEVFKDITKEESAIVEQIKKTVNITSDTMVLDIGCAKGVITKAIQPNYFHITLVDFDETESDGSLTFIQGKWEDVTIDDQYDVVLLSHVWGHFAYTNTTKQAFNKALSNTKDGGRVLLCYNSNDDFVGELINFSKESIGDIQYDVFDESLLKGLEYAVSTFSVPIHANSFKELADFVRVLIIAPDNVYDAKMLEMEKFLSERLDKPEFTIGQKLVVVSK